MRLLVSLVLSLGMLCGHAAADTMPNIVQQYADAFIDAHPEEEPPANGRSLSDVYAAAFFSGFTYPYGGMQAKSQLVRDAYTHGQAYWNDHPAERKDIFAGYGYLPIDKTGLWSRGFEVSAFMPDDGDGPWWMNTLGGVRWSDVGVPEARKGKIRVHIIGYVSATGRHGHLGGYAREVLVLSGGPSAE